MITRTQVTQQLIYESVVSFLEESGTTKTTSDEVKVLITCMSNMIGALLKPDEIDKVYKSIAKELKIKEPRKKK